MDMPSGDAKMKQPKKIHEKEAQERAIDRMLYDVPAEDRGLVIMRALKQAGGMTRGLHQKFEECPSCHKNLVPVVPYQGIKRCRNCGQHAPVMVVA